MGQVITPEQWEFFFDNYDKVIKTGKKEKQLTPEQYKKYIEYLRNKSALPKFLQWIPSVINAIDDAQDLVSTALFLARPLLRKLPQRFVPYAGWALTAVDAANITNQVLGSIVIPGLSKADFYKEYRRIKQQTKDPTLRFRDWIKKTKWRGKVGFLLQAAQAAETITGYGLSLGPIIGAVEETLWKSIWTGVQDVWQNPEWESPGVPLTQKAARVLVQLPQIVHVAHALPDEDNAMLLYASNLATGIAEYYLPQVTDERAEKALSLRPPAPYPWKRAAQQALYEIGAAGPGDVIPAYPGYEVGFTTSDAIDISQSRTPKYLKHLQAAFPNPHNRYLPYSCTYESGMGNITHLTGFNEQDLLMPDNEMISIGTLIESGIKPRGQITTSAANTWIQQSRRIATMQGRDLPTPQIFVEAARLLGIKLTI